MADGTERSRREAGDASAPRPALGSWAEAGDASAPGPGPRPGAGPGDSPAPEPSVRSGAEAGDLPVSETTVRSWAEAGDVRASESTVRSGAEAGDVRASESTVRSWAEAGDVPEPPWRSARRAASRAPLTRAAIVAAALRVLDAEGMDGLSMRRVGEELGTGAASIYWHVRNKEQLLQLIFERVTEEVELPDPDPAHWKEQLGTLAVQMRAILNSHRDIARISLGRIPSGPAIAVLVEWLFTLLGPVGIPDKVIAYLGDLFGLYTGAFAYEESLGAATFADPDFSPEEFVAMLRDYVLSLPADRFPHTRRAVDLVFSTDREDRYAFGIDLMLRGLETYATKPAR